MANAELQYNPYLLETEVKFNGQDPKINSQIEKYEKQLLADWVREVPKMFYDEMNGYDFDLFFSGTEYDFQKLQQTFISLGVTPDQVRLIMRNELEDAEIKSNEIRELIEWLRENRNRQFDFDGFCDANRSLLEETFSCIVIRGKDEVPKDLTFTLENVKSVDEIAGTNLTYVPVVFVIEAETIQLFRNDLLALLGRKDVEQNQLFFCISPIMDKEYVVRFISDLGIEEPQIISRIDDGNVATYIKNYPMVAYVGEVIRVFEDKVKTLDDHLKAKNEQSVIENAEVYEQISELDDVIEKIKASDMCFADLDNYSEGNRFNDLKIELEEMIRKWKSRKTKVVGDVEIDRNSTEYEQEIARYLGEFYRKAIEHFGFEKEKIEREFSEIYLRQPLDSEYKLEGLEVIIPDNVEVNGIKSVLLELQEERYEENNKSLNMHTFITGSTGSGKSNTVYQILMELRQDRVPFLVIEPAKGEYKDVFGHLPDVNVFSTNPGIAQLININPFKFPRSIHVLEHIDGLVEIFSVCWPMYDAMPAFFKDAILKSYEVVGWDLGSSTFEGEDVAYPDFEVLAEQLDKLITNSDYAAEIKSNYRGALLTRVKSLAVGLNKYIFTEEQTPYGKLFDENCILDISRVKSSETKALLMGLMVYILNEYRVDRKTENNNGLRHVTVLEEAHNLLKNTSSGESELIGKSVEMITNTIAEIRTYGEGFVIVDQSPSSVDIAAIKNTNTKIVLRTPEANDREAVGKSMGLSTAQVNEIAKLPSGVAVVYQNNWISPVLTLVDKAKVKEVAYQYDNPVVIKTAREARTELLCMLLQPWINRGQYRGKALRNDLKALDLSKKIKDHILTCIDQYLFFQGNMIWKTEEIAFLQELVKELLGISDVEFENIVIAGNPDELRTSINQKTAGLSYQEIEEVCCVLTMETEKDGE